MRRVPVREARQEGAWKEGTIGTHAAPPNIGIRSTDDKAWVRGAHFSLHVGRLWVAVHDTKNGI